MPTKTRITISLDESTRAAARKAAALKGMNSLTEYIVHLVKQDAGAVIREHQTIIVEDDVYDRFIAACETAEPPNKKLREAMEFAKKQGIR